MGSIDANSNYNNRPPHSEPIKTVHAVLANTNDTTIFKSYYTYKDSKGLTLYPEKLVIMHDNATPADISIWDESQGDSNDVPNGSSATPIFKLRASQGYSVFSFPKNTTFSAGFSIKTSQASTYLQLSGWVA